MTALWQNDGSEWTLLSPKPFDREATLHDRVQEAPQLLPLSGSPGLVMLGREVACGRGWADLVAVEPLTGRLVLIEVKLANNEESRRAVVAQLLSYAAFVRGLSLDQLNDVLRPQLLKLGRSTVTDAVSAADEVGTFDQRVFEDALSENLLAGAFRLVFVLDSAPADLVRLVGYLESISSDALVIDLVTVSAFQIGDTEILVPQRVDPERDVSSTPSGTRATATATVTPGIEGFRDAIDGAPAASQDELRRLALWAGELESLGLARLFTSHGRGRKTLVARLPGEDVGLVTVWMDTNDAYLQVFRSVFERRAPHSLQLIEETGVEIRQGTSIKNPTSAELELLKRAYMEASERLVPPS